MKKRMITVAAMVAVGMVLCAVITYRLNFGGSVSPSQGAWGQFGDFFGGVLNPLFAMLAFLALLWSISIQAEEFRGASEHLAKQSALAARQLEALRSDSLNQELLHVIKDIDSRLMALLSVSISPPGVPQIASISMMVSEAERLANFKGESESYAAFLVQAKTHGSVIEAPVREIATLVGEMRSFLEQWSNVRAGDYAPVIVYYANKVYKLLYMLEDVGCISADTRRFFATVSDPHG